MSRCITSALVGQTLEINRKPSSRRPASQSGAKGAGSINVRTAKALLPIFVVLASLMGSNLLAETATPPNILWLTSEDNGPHLGCYGDAYADTPRLDELAARSVRYRTCWSNAPVCAPARTTIISGMYATSLGAENMRSGVALPEDIRLYPAVLRAAGYYCTNNSKTDYNFASKDSDAGWHEVSGKAHYRNRPDASMPFFAVFNFTTTHESQIRNQPKKAIHDPAKAPLPSYHPDTPEVRKDWAQYYDRISEMDAQIGEKLDELKASGLADNTIVFYYGDHGSGMPRSKRLPFNSGLHVPLIVHIPDAYQHLAPENYDRGSESTRLVSFVDLGPTAISLAGKKPPANMQGVPFLGQHTEPEKDFLFGYRGRMDERIDMVRSCTDGRFVYMRNFYPDRPYLAHVDYMFQTPTTQVWHSKFEAGELSATQEKFWQPKPLEELFDLESDPDEVYNLADDPQYEETLVQMRAALKQWMIDTKDLGVLPEAEVTRRCDNLAPRTFASSDRFDAATVVNSAWSSTTAWEAADENTVASLGRQSQASESGLRFWAARGLTLALWSHGSVLPESAIENVEQSLVRLLQDESPSVRVAAAEGALISGNAGLCANAATALLDLANLQVYGNITPVEALNVIDLHHADMTPGWRDALARLPREVKKDNSRTAKYAGLLIRPLVSP